MNDLFLVVGLVIVGLVVLLFGLGALLVRLADTRGATYGTGRFAANVIKGIVGLAIIGGLFYLNTLIVTALYVDPNVWEAECRAARDRGCDGLEGVIGLASIIEFGILYSLWGRIFGRGGRQRRNE